MLDGDDALQAELGEGAVGDAAGRAVCEVSRAAFLSPHALPRLGLLAWERPPWLEGGG